MRHLIEALLDRLPFVDVATGSLGQGLSVAGGMAYSSKYLDKVDNR
jgi:transketolase